MRAGVPLLSGLLFGAGLVLSGMTRPAKIIGFLDFFGAWDPALLFVMLGAVAVHGAGYWLLVRRREKPLWAPSFEVPAETKVNVPLIAGSAVFGVGWGLGGFCPGPAVVALAALDLRPAVFVAAMAAGMAVHRMTSGAGADDACG